METPEAVDVKQVIADNSGMKVDEITPVMEETYREEMANAGEPVPDSVPEEKEAVITEGAEEKKVIPENGTEGDGKAKADDGKETIVDEKKPPESKETKEVKIPDLPDDLKDHYVSKGEMDKLVSLDSLSEGDPTEDKSHPLYGKLSAAAEKIIKDNVRSARDSMIKVEEMKTQLDGQSDLKTENERLKGLLFDGDGKDKQNDPKNRVYGGISLEDVQDSTDTEHDLQDYLDAKATYDDSQRQHETNKKAAQESEAEFEASFAKEKSEAQAEFGLDDETFKKMDDEFTNNPIPVKTLLAGQMFLDKFGGFDSVVTKEEHESGVKTAVEEATSKLLQTLQNRRSGKNVDIPSGGGKNKVPGKGKVNDVVSQFKKNAESVMSDPKLRKEFIALSDAATAEGNHNFLDDYED